jgi:hypothetical protein
MVQRVFEKVQYLCAILLLIAHDNSYLWYALHVALLLGFQRESYQVS